MKKTISIQVFGKVQGVWFRASTKNKADELGIKGRVQNYADGSVFIEATGSNSAIDFFIDWCKDGPPFAKVDKIKVATLANKSFPDFRIIR